MQDWNCEAWFYIEAILKVKYATAIGRGTLSATVSTKIWAQARGAMGYLGVLTLPLPVRLTLTALPPPYLAYYS